MGRIKVDQETRAEIFEMINNGKSPKEIAEELGFVNSNYIRQLKHGVKRNDDEINEPLTLERSVNNSNNEIKTLDEKEVIRSASVPEKAPPNLTFEQVLINVKESSNSVKSDSNTFTNVNNSFNAVNNEALNVKNENQTVPNTSQNVSNSNLTLEKQKRNTLFSSVLLGVLIACLKFNGVEEVKLVLTQFSIAKDSVGLVSMVLVAAPLVLLIQPQNDKTRYYSIAVFVIICLLQVFCAAISINQALGTAFEKAITEATPFQKSSFTYWMSPVRPLLELLMELVLLGNLKQR